MNIYRLAGAIAALGMINGMGTETTRLENDKSPEDQPREPKPWERWWPEPPSVIVRTPKPAHKRGKGQARKATNRAKLKAQREGRR